MFIWIGTQTHTDERTETRNQVQKKTMNCERRQGKPCWTNTIIWQHLMAASTTWRETSNSSNMLTRMICTDVYICTHTLTTIVCTSVYILWFVPLIRADTQDPMRQCIFNTMSPIPHKPETNELEGLDTTGQKQAWMKSGFLGRLYIWKPAN